MNTERNGIDLKNIGLYKIFSNLDTQSAVVAAVVISLITVVATGFINLCNYVYWSAYFNKFKIPLAYIGEAIIHEKGTKYLVVLYIPVLFLVWWLLGILKNVVITVCKKVKEIYKRKPVPRFVVNLGKGFKILFFVLFLFCSVYGFLMLLVWHNSNKLVLLLLYAECVIFILWSVCNGYWKEKVSFSAKKYYFIRGIALVVAVYLMLGHVYFAGSNDNYGNDGIQNLQVLYDSKVNFFELEEETELQSQLVLFETADYYYVADVTIVGGNYPTVRLWGNETYRFVSKVEYPVKNMNAYLAYVGTEQSSFFQEVHFEFVLLSIATVFAFVPLLSIPQKEKQH